MQDGRIGISGLPVKPLRFSLIALLAPLLGGCFSIDQTLDARNASTAMFEVRAAVPASTLAAAQNVPGLAGRPFCADKGAAEKLGLTVTVETFTEGENQICVMKARGPMETIARVAADKSYLPKDAPSQANALTYLLEPSGSGVWTLTMSLKPPAELRALSGNDDMTRAAQAMIFGSLTGRGVNWAVEAAEVLESTGTVNPNRTRAEYQLPLQNVLSNPQPEYRFVTKFRSAS